MLESVLLENIFFLRSRLNNLSKLHKVRIFSVEDKVWIWPEIRSNLQLLPFIFHLLSSHVMFFHLPLLHPSHFCHSVSDVFSSVSSCYRKRPDLSARLVVRSPCKSAEETPKNSPGNLIVWNQSLPSPPVLVSPPPCCPSTPPSASYLCLILLSLLWTSITAKPLWCLLASLQPQHVWITPVKEEG